MFLRRSRSDADDDDDNDDLKLQPVGPALHFIRLAWEAFRARTHLFHHVVACIAYKFYDRSSS